MRKLSPEASLRLLQKEPGFSYMTFATPILSVFYLRDIGMSFTQVGAAQAAYTIALLFCQIPAGRLADRFSRRWCNVGGNLIAAGAYVGYASADSFTGVIIAECIVGLGLAFSDGADTALCHFFAGLSARGDAALQSDIFARVSARVARDKRLGRGFAYLVGGGLGITHPRLVILLAAVALLVAAGIVWFVPEPPRPVGDRPSPRGIGRETRAEIGRTYRYLLKVGRTRNLWWRIWAMAACSQTIIAFGMILLTPLLLAAHVPSGLIGFSWLVMLAAEIIGVQANASARAGAMASSRRFVVAAVVAVIGFGVFAGGSQLSAVVLALSTCCLGFSLGWTDAMTAPVIIAASDGEDTATLFSVVRTIEAATLSGLLLLVGAFSRRDPWMGALVLVIIAAVSFPLLWSRLRPRVAATA